METRLWDLRDLPYQPAAGHTYCERGSRSREVEYTPIGPDNEDVVVNGEVFAVAAAYVESDGAGWEIFEKTLYDGPGLRMPLSVTGLVWRYLYTWLEQADLVAGGGEVGRNLFVNCVHMLAFVVFSSVCCRCLLV